MTKTTLWLSMERCMFWQKNGKKRKIVFVLNAHFMICVLMEKITIILQNYVFHLYQMVDGFS